MSRGTVSLVAARTFEAAALEPWFAAAWADMWGPEPPLQPLTAAGWLVAEDGFERAVALLDGVAVGVVAYRTVEALLELSALTVAREERNAGVGAEIVAQLEAKSGVRRAMASFPLANGYAFYFWLRSGYRPAFPERRNAGVNLVWRALG